MAREKTAVEGSRARLTLWVKGNMYFVLLKAQWSRILLFIGASYIITVAVCAALLRAVMAAEGPDLGEQWDGLSNWEAALWMGASNILSLGPGRFTPNSTELSFFCCVQQFGGLILNVFLFSIVVTKFQQPQADVVFSEKAVLTTRDAQPCFIFRLGNKRCNRIYLPTVVVSLMHRRATEEGESFVEMMPLKVRQPASVAGAITVCHILDKTSPLRVLLAGGDPLSDTDDDEGKTDIKTIVASATEASFAVSVVFSGHDNIYGSDLTAHHVYYHQGGIGGDIAFGGWLLDDVFVRDPRSGRMKVDFDRFSRLRPVAPPPDAVKDASGHGYVCFKPGGGVEGYASPEAPDLKLGRIYMCTGGTYFAEKFRKTCGFTVICELLLLNLGVDYEVITIDLDSDKKPQWFTEQTKGTTPAMYLNGTWLCDSSDIIAKLAELFPVQAAALKAGDCGAVDDAFLGSFIGPLVKYLMSKPPEADTPGPGAAAATKGAKVAVTAAEKSEDPLRSAVEEQVAVIADQLAASGGPFLTGAKFCWNDCRLLPMLMMPVSIAPMLPTMGKNFDFLEKYPRVLYYVEAGCYSLDRGSIVGSFRTSDDAAGLALRKRAVWAPSDAGGRRARDLWLARVFAKKLHVPAMLSTVHAREYATLEAAERDRAAAAGGGGGAPAQQQQQQQRQPPQQQKQAHPTRSRGRLGRRSSFATQAVASPNTRNASSRPNLCI